MDIDRFKGGIIFKMKYIINIMDLEKSKMFNHI